MHGNRRPLLLTIFSILSIALQPGTRIAAQAPAPPAQTPDQPRNEGNRYRFEVWDQDFPVPLELPAPATAPWYESSRRQALARVVANLQGNTRREVWLMATEFFWRAPADAVDLLIEAMDRAFPQPALQDVVRNSIEAMGKMARVEFDDALRRALEHPYAPVRQAAYAALGTSGKVETVRWARQYFPQMDGRARESWLHAVRLRLGDEAVPIYRELMVPETPGPIRDMVLKETMQLAPKDAAQVLRRLWPEATADFKAMIAGVFHSAGDGEGTAWLHAALDDNDPAVVVRALRQLVHRDLGVLREQVLRLSTHSRPEVRYAVAEALVGVPGDDVARTYEVLAAPDELFETKAVALRELTRTGHPDSVTALLEDVGTSTGTRLDIQLRLLGASGDDRAVPVFRDRFGHAPPGEGRAFLQALAFCGAKDAPAALLDLFLLPDRPVSPPDQKGRQLTSMTYIPVLLPNLRGAEAKLCAAFERLPAHDHARAALWLHALADIAADREDAAVREPIHALLRRILFDRDELPQLRILALNALTRKAITLDDAMQLKRQQEIEKGPMRALIKDYLIEYF